MRRLRARFSLHRKKARMRRAARGWRGGRGGGPGPSWVEWLDRLNHDLEVPRLRDCCGGDVDKFRATLPKMATDALESGSPQNNPVVPAASQIVELFEVAW